MAQATFSGGNVLILAPSLVSDYYSLSHLFLWHIVSFYRGVIAVKVHCSPFIVIIKQTHTRDH